MKHIFMFISMSLSLLAGITDKFDNELGTYEVTKKISKDEYCILSFNFFLGEKNYISFYVGSDSHQNYLDYLPVFKELWEYSKIDKSGFKSLGLTYPSRYPDLKEEYIRTWPESKGNNLLERVRSNIRLNKIYSQYLYYLEDWGYTLDYVSTEKHGYLSPPNDKVYAPFLVIFSFK